MYAYMLSMPLIAYQHTVLFVCGVSDDDISFMLVHYMPAFLRRRRSFFDAAVLPMPLIFHATLDVSISYVMLDYCLMLDCHFDCC